MCFLWICYVWVFGFLEVNEIEHKINAFNLFSFLKPCCCLLLRGLPGKIVLQSRVQYSFNPYTISSSFPRSSISADEVFLFVFPHYSRGISHVDLTDFRPQPQGEKWLYCMLSCLWHYWKEEPRVYPHIGNTWSVSLPSLFGPERPRFHGHYSLEARVYVNKLEHFWLGLTECSSKQWEFTCLT